MLTVPSITDLPNPPLTNNPNLPVVGLRPPNTQVVAVFNDQRQAVLTTVGEDPNWSGVLPLLQGENGFVLVAQRATGVSSPSELYSLTLNLYPPSTPIIDGDYNNTVYVWTGGSQTLTGSKDPNGDLTINGNEIVTAAQGLSSWQYPLTGLTTGAPVVYCSGFEELGRQRCAHADGKRSTQQTCRL